MKFCICSIRFRTSTSAKFCNDGWFTFSSALFCITLLSFTKTPSNSSFIFTSSSSVFNFWILVPTYPTCFHAVLGTPRTNSSIMPTRATIASPWSLLLNASVHQVFFQLLLVLISLPTSYPNQSFSPLSLSASEWFQITPTPSQTSNSQIPNIHTFYIHQMT